MCIEDALVLVKILNCCFCLVREVLCIITMFVWFKISLVYLREDTREAALPLSGSSGDGRNPGNLEIYPLLVKLGNPLSNHQTSLQK